MKCLCKVKNIYGSFTDWYLEYWKICNTGEAKNLLFIKYEDIVMDLEGQVKKFANFLDEELTKYQLDIIVHNCTFKSMSKPGENNAKGVFASKFFRKGEIGDYKNYLSDEQISRCEEEIVKVLKADGLEFQY